jgi:hypothetical protein
MKGVLGILASVFVLRRLEQPGPRRKMPWLDVYERAQGTALEELLPDRPGVRSLERRLEAAAQRLIDLDRLLARPELSEEAAQEHRRMARRRRDQVAVRLIELRLRNLERLRLAREQLASDLEEIRELLVELRLQADVVRDAGWCGAGTRALVEELLARMERL